MDEQKSDINNLPAAKKIIIGGIVFVLGQISPLILIPVVVSFKSIIWMDNSTLRFAHVWIS